MSSNPLLMSKDIQTKDSESATPKEGITRQDKVKQQFREVSELYEKQFLREMVKSMRSTISESGLVKVNQAEKIFREQLDGEYVEGWQKKGGIGLSDVIYNNMMDRFGEKFGVKQRIEKPQGPLQLKEQDNYFLKTSNDNKEGQNYQFKDIKSVDGKPVAIKMPWQGYLTKKIQLSPDEYFLEASHGNHLTSQFHFKGNLSDLSADSIEAGSNLGTLSPDSNTLNWKVLKSE